MQENNKFVSIIIRTLEGRMHFLDRALFSVFCNTYPYKESIIVCQGCSEDYTGKLSSYQKIYPEMKIKAIRNSTPLEKDERAKNLNLGIKNSTGRYLCFLDDDDLFYPHHLTTLIKLLKETDKIWAYSQVCLDMEDNGFIVKKNYFFRHDYFSFRKFLIENFIPLHTFLVDTLRLKDKSLLLADESLTRYEDYYILLNLAFRYEPAFFPGVTSSYTLRADGSNTNKGIINQNSDEKMECTDEEWEKAKEKIEQTKRQFYQKFYWINDFLDEEKKERLPYSTDKSWNLFLKCLKIRDFVFPEGTRRRYMLTRLFKYFLDR